MQKEFFTANRQKLAEHLKDGDGMLFFSGKPIRKTADEDYGFFASRNFLYLTGIQQRESVLLITKASGKLQEKLFVLKPDVAREVWTGRRHPFDEVKELSGVEQVFPTEQLEGALNRFFFSDSQMTLWLCFDALAPRDTPSLEQDFAKHIQEKYPFVTIKNSYPLVCAQRKIKSPEEIEAIRTAMKITEAGIRRMMKTARPGMMEYELESEFNHELARHGQRHTAFPSIISAGERNFYLHYSELMGRINEGDLILTDVGSPYDEYNTDISRVFPANGCFSERQKAIYEIAFKANRAIMAQVKPGVPFSMCNQVCREVCFEGLKSLGILDDFSKIQNYVWHGVAHHIGLDTHDVGGYAEPMAENMVFTVDAGIYVREWGVGLRIEDNVRVTADGCENLSASIPSTVEEIEAWMAE